MHRIEEEILKWTRMRERAEGETQIDYAARLLVVASRKSDAEFMQLSVDAKAWLNKATTWANEQQARGEAASPPPAFQFAVGQDYRRNAVAPAPSVAAPWLARVWERKRRATVGMFRLNALVEGSY